MAVAGRSGEVEGAELQRAPRYVIVTDVVEP